MDKIIEIISPAIASGVARRLNAIMASTQVDGSLDCTPVAYEVCAALSAAGYRVVPAEPTEAMTVAGMETAPTTQLRGTGWRLSLSTEHCANIYRAMLAAAGGQSNG